MIATMSGDGLLHEVVNGIMGRPDWEKALDSLALGIVTPSSFPFPFPFPSLVEK